MLVLILPLVTTPYVSRVLGAENIGIYSYTQSIAAYFIMFGSLGMALYAQREIAYQQNDVKGYSRTFWELFLLKGIMLLISCGIFWLLFAAGDGELSLYYKILIIEILGNIFDISWFFQGLEDFKKTATRSILVKMISVVCVFLFVRSKDDLVQYFLIYTLSVIVGNLSLWLYLPDVLSKTRIKFKRIFRHLRPTITLFIPQIAVQVYTILDRVMIGAIIDDKSEVGYYEQSQRIVKILMTVVTSLGVVLMPRLANSYAKGERESITRYIKTSFNVVFILAFPIVFGLISVADVFVPLFFGQGYDKVCILLYITGPIVLLIGMSSVLGNQYLLAVKRQKEYTVSVVCGACVNVLLNSILISKLGAVGAAIATLVAETTVLAVQLFFTRKDFSTKEILTSGIKYLIGSLIMSGALFILNHTVLRQVSKMTHLLLDVLFGALIYLLYLILTKDVFFVGILRRAKEIIKKHRPVGRY